MYQCDYFSPGSGKPHRRDCHKRLDLIRRHMLRGGGLLDVGCNLGYYTFALSGDFEFLLGIDTDVQLIERCERLRQQHQITSVRFCHADVSRSMAQLAGRDWRVVLYMSVHHHVVEQTGGKQAACVLYRLSELCDQMFFDMGQKNERCPQHPWWRALPECRDPEDWLREYLQLHTCFRQFSLIGSSPVHGVERLLWNLVK